MHCQDACLFVGDCRWKIGILPKKKTAIVIIVLFFIIFIYLFIYFYNNQFPLLYTEYNHQDNYQRSIPLHFIRTVTLLSVAVLDRNLPKVVCFCLFVFELVELSCYSGISSFTLQCSICENHAYVGWSCWLRCFELTSLWHHCCLWAEWWPALRSFRRCGGKWFFYLPFILLCRWKKGKLPSTIYSLSPGNTRTGKLPTQKCLNLNANLNPTQTFRWLNLLHALRVHISSLWKFKVQFFNYCDQFVSRSS